MSENNGKRQRPTILDVATHYAWKVRDLYDLGHVSNKLYLSNNKLLFLDNRTAFIYPTQEWVIILDKSKENIEHVSFIKKEEKWQVFGDLDFRGDKVKSILIECVNMLKEARDGYI